MKIAPKISPPPRRRKSAPGEVLRNAWLEANEAMLLLDSSLRVVAMNPAARTLYLVRKETDLIGMPLKRLRTLAARSQLAPQFRKVDRTGRGRWESQHKRMDGIEIEVEVSVRRIRQAGWSGYIYIVRDITSRKRAQESIRMQAQMLNAIGEAVIATDPTGLIIYANRVARKLYGWDATDPVGHHIMEVTVPSENRAEGKRIMQRLRAGRIWQGEFIVRRRDGRTFPAHLTNAPVLDDQGRLVAIIGVSNDISERKQTADVLRLAEAKQRRLAEQLREEKIRLLAAQQVAKVGSWETDISTGRVTWSEETHRIFSTDPAKFKPTHQRFLQRVHPEDRPKVEETFGNSLTVREPSRIEHRLRLPGGRVKYVEERWQTFFDDQGRPVRAVGTCQDITERKLSDLEREKLIQLVERSPDFIVLSDLKRKFTYMNAAAQAMIGLETDQDPGSVKVTDYTPKNWHEFLLTTVMPTVEELGHWEGEIPVLNLKTGRIIEAHRSIFQILDAAGEPHSLAVITRDITRAKEAEEQLRVSERQLHALVARLHTVREEEAKRIARELHDDLGQHLTALIMELSGLARSAPGATTSLPATLVRMQQLVEHTITTVQKIAGELRLGQLDVLGLTAAMVWHLQEFSRLSGIPCRITRLDEVEGLSDVQSTTLFRILQEALTNIVRHAGATEVAVGLLGGRERVTLTVRDNGRGIAPAALLTPDSLGLLGMRERAQLVGGSLAVSAAEGGGTLVQVEIPRKPATPPNYGRA